MIKQIIISPYITEKSMSLVSANKYSFMVDKKAQKPQIVEAIKELYKVNPINIQIQVYKGKKVVFKHRYKGQKKDVKKAIISLPKKEKIKDFVIKEK